MATTMERTESRTAAPSAAPPTTPALALGLSIAAAAAAVWAIAAAPGNGSSAALQAALAAVWAGSSIFLARRGEGTAPVVAAGALVGAVGAANGDAAPFAAGLLPAIGMHLVLSMPDGTIQGTPRWVLLGIGYAAGVATGIGLWTARPDFPLWPLGVLIAALTVLAAGPAFSSFRRAVGPGRRRIEWLGWGATVTGGLALLLGGLSALVDWPHHVGEGAGGVTVFIPLGLVLGSSARARQSIDRVLAATISLAGLTAVVVAVYMAIVLGLGRVPRHSERTLLVLSMAAAGVAALLYLPAHRRLRDFATRLVYGERSAPDDVIRNFGARLSRAIPLDELLLQMAESLRKTLGLASAEVWRASGGTVELAVADPETKAPKLSLTDQEEQTVARAGVSGPAWIKVWLPRLLAGREEANLRVAPATHSGELLGLVVVERPAD